MKIRHNKKRNIAFIYEAIMRELTKVIVEESKDEQNTLIGIVRTHFNKDSLIAKELRLYRTLYETINLQPHTAEKLIYEVKDEYQKLDKKKLFFEQSRLIKILNKNTSKSFFSNFVPNYKTLATLNQIFNYDGSVKERVLLEQHILDRLVSNSNNQDETMKPVDNLVFTSFVKKYNSEYETKLLSEQKSLLSKFISSFVDNGVELKIFLNEEISRLKDVIKQSLSLKEVQDDSLMLEKTKTVLTILDNFKNNKIDHKAIKVILGIQNLAKEIQIK